MHECKQEQRLRYLEHAEAVMNTEIKNLILELGKLTGWIKALILAFIPITVAVFGFLLVYWIKG